MSMANDSYMSPDQCNSTVTKLFAEVSTSLVNVTVTDVKNLRYFCEEGFKAEANAKFSRPLVVIGMYIALLGSAPCILAMLADLLFVPNRVLQIPYKYFSLNAATITVLSIAMKLPLDMTGEMPGYLDQATKLGSLAFMCTMLANLIPNLASMENKTLVSNLVGLAILVITISVNVSIEIFTGVIDHKSLDHFLEFSEKYKSGQMRFNKGHYFVRMAFLYIASMLLLLLISISAAIGIPSMKKVLEHKYQVRMKALREEPATTLVELKQHVTKYWIMAKTGSPHFVMIASPLFIASCIICITSTITYIVVLGKLITGDAKNENFGSDYRWSMAVILITQLIGIIIGDFILLLRYINSIRIKLNSYNLRVEKYWYARLCEWKGRHIAFPEGGRRRRTFVHTLKNSFLNLCIMLQTVLLVICKILELVSLYTHAFIRTCRSPIDSLGDVDLGKNVLCVEDKVPIDKYALHFLLEFKNGLVKKAQKKENSNLLELLRKSNGFKEGQNFAISQVQIPPSVMLESWSLPVVTLTCIAIVVPDSQDQIDGLIKSVDQALVYAHLVEESFNSEHEYANMHKTTMDIWYEVKDACKWLKTSLRRDAFQEKTPTQILKWFDDTAEAIVTRKSTVVLVEPWENYPDYKLICESMHSISSSILSKYQNGTQLSTKVDFFQLLSSMIADILFACLSNIPQVITRKCHAKEIEKREARVEAAVQILARTTKILEILETPKLPILDHHEMASVDKWRHPLIQPPTDPELSSV